MQKIRNILWLNSEKTLKNLDRKYQFRRKLRFPKMVSFLWFDRGKPSQIKSQVEGLTENFWGTQFLGPSWLSGLKFRFFWNKRFSPVHSLYWPVTLCKKSETSYDSILRKLWKTSTENINVGGKWGFRKWCLFWDLTRVNHHKLSPKWRVWPKVSEGPNLGPVLALWTKIQIFLEQTIFISS